MELDARTLRLLKRTSAVPPRSALRSIELPDDVWAAYDAGALLLVGDFGPIVLDESVDPPQLIHPSGAARDALLATITASALSPPAAAQVWTSTWPAEEGWYWFYGRRPQDRLGDPPTLRVATAEIVVERTLTGMDSRGQCAFTEQDQLRVTSDGRALVEGQGFCSGVWAPISNPTLDTAADLFEDLPPPSAGSEVVIHCARGGTTLCGVALVVGAPVARAGQLALITCPACRVAAERL